MAETEQEDTGHLTEEGLARLLANELSAAEFGPVLRHLLRGCTRCREMLAPLAEPPGERETSAPGPTGEDYELAFARALVATQEQARVLAENRQRARRELANLLAACGKGPIPVERLRPAPKTPPAARWAWCEALIEAAAERRGADPFEAVKLGEQAVRLAESFRRSRFPARDVADLRGAARTEYGNLLRVVEDLAGAERELAEAGRRLAKTRELRLFARLQDVSGSLFRALRRFKEALDALSLAELFYRECGEHGRVARVLVKRGFVLVYAGRPEEAIPVLERAIAGLNVEREPALLLAAAHNLLYALAEAGRAEESSRFLTPLRAIYESVGTPLERVKFVALEATVAVGHGDPVRAEQLFREARAGYERLGRRYLVAITSLELAAVLLEQGRPAEVPGLVGQALATFQILGIGREYLAALILLHESAEQGTATAALVREAARQLRYLEFGERLPN